MYDPTPGDMIRISEADMFIYTGAEMEPWAQELADSVDMSKVKVVDASSGVSMMKEEDEEHEHAEAEEDSAHAEEDSHDHSSHHHEHTYDPHIWLDMQNAIQMVKNIEDAFCEADPANAETYKADVLPMVISFTVMAWSMRAFMTAVRRIRSRAWHRWRM